MISRWGRLPEVNDRGGYGEYMKECRKFGAAIWQFTGKGNDVDLCSSIRARPPSRLVLRRGAAAWSCSAPKTTGYNITFDALRVDAPEASKARISTWLQASQPTGSSSSAASIPACRKCSPGSTSPRRT